MNKVILWDFDGVLMDSNSTRDLGFKEVLKEYPKEQIAALMDYHQRNGGLSRYVKFRYFFETIRGEEIDDKNVQLWADKFSTIMKEILVNPALLIQDSMDFVTKHYQHVAMHIVSGSDQSELRHICKACNISQYFKSIHGSPTPKIELVKQVLQDNAYQKDDCLLIGDSINDKEAAEINGIDFRGYNNVALKQINHKYINSFKNYED